jgi:quinoprotein relay system zinc metallohydrolase 2
MKKIQMLKFFYVFIFFFLVSPLIIAGNKIKPLNVKKIGDGVYVYYGKHESIYEDGNIGDIANLGFIIGDESIAVIDTGGSHQVGEALKLAIKKISDKPIKYVINTHAHQDHIFGNTAFISEGAVIYGHFNLKKALKERGSQYIKQLSEAGDKVKGTRIIFPHIVIAGISSDQSKKLSNKITIDLGNRKLQLTSYEVAHTYSDASVYDIKTKTFFVGDLVQDERLPTMDGLTKNWIKVLNEIEKVDFKIMVPGHGKIQTNNTALNKTRKYLQVLYDEVIESLKKDIPIEEGLKTIAQSEKNNWILFDRVNPGNIVRTFMRYEWEY